jgi:hypothetical protein
MQMSLNPAAFNVREKVRGAVCRDFAPRRGVEMDYSKIVLKISIK